MIKNEKQYQVTKTALKNFESQLADLLKFSTKIDPFLKEIKVNAYQSQIQTLRQEVNEYEKLKDGNINFIYIDSITNIGEALIKARIIRGWTQGELAAKLGLKEQQIQRYEICNYRTASIDRINHIISKLEIGIHAIKLKIDQPEIFNKDEVAAIDFNKVKASKSLFQMN